MTSVTVAAVDLGASGGRVMAGQVSDSGVALHEVHRFPNEPVTAGGTLYWDILRLYADVRHGLEAAARQFPLASAGIDSWGVDYGLLDESGALLGNPVHYRDARTDGVAARVHAAVPAAELYAVTGIQHLPFNTIYQLAATPMLRHAATMLLIPDLLAYWLTGEAGAEVTNASTTSLFDVRAQAWATGGDREGRAPAAHLPAVAPAGRGHRSHYRAERAGFSAPGHRGRLARHGVGGGGRARGGTGLRLHLLGHLVAGRDGARRAGADRGEPRRQLHQRDRHRRHDPLPAQRDGPVAAAGEPAQLAGSLARTSLLAEAARLPPLRFVIDPDDPVFLPPGDMPARIASWLADRGEAVPAGPAETVRCILDSLALAYRRAIAEAQSLSGRHADVVHIVGGGARNALLCQLTADATGLPVIAGPAEATALRQRARPGPRPGRGARRPGRDARADPVHPAAALPCSPAGDTARPGPPPARRGLPSGSLLG